MMATASGLAQAPLVTAARGGAGCSTRKGAVPIQRAGRAGRPQIAVSAVRHALPVGARRRTGTSRVLQRVQAIGEEANALQPLRVSGSFLTPYC